MKSFLFQIVLIAAFVYFTLHFNENPIVVTVVLLILIFCYCVGAGYQKITIYEESMEVKGIHPIAKLSRTRSFLFSDIKSIDVNLQLTKRNYWISEMLSTSMPGNSFWNILVLEMNNEKKIEVATKVYQNELLILLDKVKMQSGNKIVVT